MIPCESLPASPMKGGQSLRVVQGGGILDGLLVLGARLYSVQSASRCAGRLPSRGLGIQMGRFLQV
jgi:hypothetical protein